MSKPKPPGTLPKSLRTQESEDEVRDSIQSVIRGSMDDLGEQNIVVSLNNENTDLSSAGSDIIRRVSVWTTDSQKTELKPDHKKQTDLNLIRRLTDQTVTDSNLLNRPGSSRNFGLFTHIFSDEPNNENIDSENYTESTESSDELKVLQDASVQTSPPAEGENATTTRQTNRRGTTRRVTTRTEVPIDHSEGSQEQDQIAHPNRPATRRGATRRGRRVHLNMRAYGQDFTVDCTSD